MAIKKYCKSINLFDKGASGIVDNAYISRVTEQLVSEAIYYLSAPIPVVVGQKYRWTFDITITSTFNAPTVGFFNVHDELIGVAPHSNNIKSFVFTVPDGCSYVRASVFKNTESESMLTQGDEEQNAYVPPYIWHEISYRKYGTETDTITSLPKEIITDGESIPSANLAHFEKGGISSSNGMDSAWTADRAPLRSQYIACEPESSYTISLSAYPVQNFTAFYDSHYSYLERTQGTSIESDRTITTPQNVSFMRVTAYHNTEGQIYPSEHEGFTAMVNEGSSVMPYTPYTGCSISGNMVQNGTPTSSAPIYP